LTVSFGAIGPLARKVSALLNMRTAASKVVHCMLHDYHVEGKELDIAYHNFKEAYCDRCPTRRKDRLGGATTGIQPSAKLSSW
jgi:hypothetical protein